MYLIRFTDEGLADAARLKKNEKNFLKKEIKDRLEKSPLENSEELQGTLKDYRSAHIENYRVVFKIYEELMAIAIVGIGKHDANAKRDTYQRLGALVNQGKFAEHVMATLRGFSRPSR